MTTKTVMKFFLYYVYIISKYIVKIIYNKNIILIINYNIVYMQMITCKKLDIIN